MTGDRQESSPSLRSGRRLAALLVVLLGPVLAVAALAAQSLASQPALVPAAAESQARCTTPNGTPLRIFHGGKLTLIAVAEPGSPAVVAVGLASGQPAQTADYELTRLTATSWRFQSLKIDRPNRTVLHRVLLRVGFAGGSQQTVRCDVSVVHRLGVASFGAKCVPNPLRIVHGGAGVFTIVPNLGSAPILSTGLDSGYPKLTPKRRITKLANHSFSFRSRVVDPPERVETYRVRVRVKFGTLSVVASIVKECVVKVRHLPAEPPRQFQVQMTTTYDHDSPQSDVCVTLTTSPRQPGARARVGLRGPLEQQTARQQSLDVVLDGSGGGRARFLVDAIGTYQVAAAVTGAGGVTSTAETTINNATPSGRCSP